MTQQVTTIAVMQMCENAEVQRQVAIELLKRGYRGPADKIAKAARLIEQAAREIMNSIEAYEKAVFRDKDVAR